MIRKLEILSFIILSTIFLSTNQWSSLQIGNTFFWIVIQLIFYYLVINIFFNYRKLKLFTDSKIIIYLLTYNLFCIIKGVFIAENYWEYKNLTNNSFYLFLPVLVYLFLNSSSIAILISTYFKYAIFIFIFFLPFLEGEAIGRFLAPIAFLSLFFPILPRKWKFIVLVVIIFVIISDVSARSNVIKFIIPLLFSLIFYFKNVNKLKLLNWLRITFLISPFILLTLTVFNIFNIFKMDDYIGEYEVAIKYKDGSKEVNSLTVDTRTFLYIEVITSAIKNDYILLGRSPARGNDSEIFGSYNREVLNTGKSERYENEASILNIFTWLGALGVILYFLIFFYSSYLAINCSNNIAIKIIGLYVSFRWFFCWIEDFSRFDLSNIFLWIMVGFCFSKVFREMTDNQIKNWILNLLAFKKRFTYTSFSQIQL